MACKVDCNVVGDAQQTILPAAVVLRHHLHHPLSYATLTEIGTVLTQLAAQQSRWRLCRSSGADPSELPSLGYAPVLPRLQRAAAAGSLEGDPTNPRTTVPAGHKSVRCQVRMGRAMHVEVSDCERAKILGQCETSSTATAVTLVLVSQAICQAQRCNTAIAMKGSYCVHSLESARDRNSRCDLWYAGRS
jgi:hypothetical protein